MKQNGRSIIKALVNLTLSVVVLLLCVFLLPRLVVLFMPLIIGWVISCMANPLIVFLESRIKIRRKAGTVVVIVAVIAAVSGICYLAVSILVRQIYGFIQEMPDMWDALADDFGSIGALADHYLGFSDSDLTEFFASLGSSIGEFVAGIPAQLDFDMGSMVGSIANTVVSTIMSLLSAYFFIAEREWLHGWLEKAVPKGFAQKYEVFYDSLKRAVGGYFKAQFRIEVWMYLLMLIGLLILQVKYALLIALLIAVIDILPFFGSGLVLVPWAAVTALGGDYARALGFLIIWGVGQLFRQLIQPKIMGDSIGMEPIPTIVLLFLGYRVAGVLGMLIAVPVGIIVVNMNDAGFFDTPKKSVQILFAEMNRFRKLNEEDLRLIEKNEEEQPERGNENGA